LAEPGEVGAGAVAPGSATIDAATAAYPGCGDAEPKATAPEGASAAVSITGYDILGVLGRGGMGVVYKARHLALKRTVALKMVLAGGHAAPQELARFRLEAEAVARLSHPNIVQIHEVGEADGQPYCALEFVEGGSLANKLKGKLPPAREAAKLVEALARAMQLAHSRNVVHRDLKPANVLLAVDGTPKITDFGLARQLDSDSGATQAGQVMGTPSYMAPEQASGRAHEAGPAADVYALGAILYECLAGRPPFKGRTVVETLDQVRTQEPAPPSRFQAGVALDLETICLKCLRKEPEKRYASAAELADDLVRYQRGEPIQARPVGRLERAVKWVKRNPVVFGAAVAVLLALVAGTTVSYLKYLEAEEARGTATKALAREEQRGEERDKANKELEYQLGVSSMVLASAAYDNRDVVLAAERLEKVPEEQRGWEWRYLKQQTRGGLFTLYGHTRPVTTVMFSQDGERIVTVTMKTNSPNEPCDVKVWDARTGTAVLELNYLFNRGASQPFSLGGTRLATAGLDNMVRLWDARSGKLQRELKHTSPVLRVVLSPDGARVATVCGDGMVRVWDANTGKPQWEFKGTRTIVAFSPDRTRLFIGPVEKQKALLCDTGTGKPLLELSGCNGIRGIAFSPDGTRIVIGSSGRAMVWDAEKGGPPLFVLKGPTLKGFRDWTSCVAFSPDGARILTSGGMDQDETALVWDARTATTLFSLKGRRGPKTDMGIMVGLGDGEQSAAFSPDGTRIVTVGGQNGAHEATVWDARTGTELLALTGHTNQVLCAAFSPDGTRIVTGCMDGTAKVWDARTGTSRLAMNAHRGQLHTVAVSPDGTRVISGGGEPNKPGAAKVWDARTGVALLELKGLKGTVMSAAFSRDGRIVTGGARQTGRDEQGFPTWTGEAIVWDARTGEALLELKGFKEGVNSIAISPDGTRIITGGGEPGEDGDKVELKVWDARSGAVLLDLTQEAEGGGFIGHTGASVAFSPDGTRFVAGGLNWKGSEANRATVRDAATGASVLELKGHKGTIQCVAFSPDGTRIVTGGGEQDHKALVWDARTGAVLLELKGHTSAVLCVAFSRDGKRIVTGSVDRTVRVWDAKTGTTLVELKGFTERVMSVAFSADGTSLVTGELGGAVTVWDARSVKPPPILKGHTGFIAHMAFSPDGTRILTSSRNELKVWDARTGAALFDLKGHTGDVWNVAFSTDGTRIVSCDGTTAKVWDSKTGSALLELKGKAEEMHWAAFSPDGTRIVTGGVQDDGGKGIPKGVAAVWDARAGTPLVEVSGLTSQVQRVAFSQDGTRFFTYLWNGPAKAWKAWDAGTGKEVPGAAIPTLNSNERLSPDGRVFAHMEGDRVELIPLQPGEEELAYRQLLWQANVGRYRDGYETARAAKDDFAARFYLKLLPPDERKELEASNAAEKKPQQEP
jgi:WD40 repeat protein